MKNKENQSLPQPFSLKPNENQKQFSARNFNYEDINIMKNKNENQPLPQPFALKKNENQENQQFLVRNYYNNNNSNRKKNVISQTSIQETITTTTKTNLENRKI